MSRRILKLIALTFAVAVAFSGCNLVKIDESMDAAEVVASFNGGTVTKGEVIPAYENTLAYYEYLYSYYGSYGYTFSTDGLLEETVDSLVQTKVLLAKAAELGLDVLSEEEEAQVQEAAETEYEDTVQSYLSSFAQDGMSDEQVREETVAFLTENEYTPDDVLAAYRENKVIEKLQQTVYEEVIVTPEDIQNEYNAKVAADEAAYSTDLFTYESTVLGGSTVAWNPEGYRTVKHILLSYTQEQQDELTDIEMQINDLEYQVTMMDIEDEAAETETVTAEEIQAQIEELNAEMADKRAAFAAELQGKVDEIMAAVEAGEDFEALMEQYNEDEGMEREPAKSVGYYVCAESESWVTEFRDAAMALENIGDVSEPVATNYGLHIICYFSDVTAGAVPMADMEDEITQSVTAKLQDEAFGAKTAEWVEAANVKIDLSVIED